MHIGQRITLDKKLINYVEKDFDKEDDFFDNDIIRDCIMNFYCQNAADRRKSFYIEALRNTAANYNCSGLDELLDEIEYVCQTDFKERMIIASKNTEEKKEKSTQTE